MRHRLPLAAMGLLLASIVHPGDPAYLVKDIRADTAVESLTMGCMVDAGSAAYLFVDEERSGGELWVTDGSPEGTRLFVDINPTGSAVYPYECPELMPPPMYHADSGLLFFVALDDDNENGGLWRSDGTVTGTFPLDRSGFPPVSVGGTVFHRGVDGELWKTDGTVSGTVQVKDIRPGPEPSYPTGLVEAGGVLVFFADDGVHGREPWRSDGTAAGTYLLSDLFSTGGSVNAADIVSVDGVGYFSAVDDAAGGELWRSDGTTAGTVRVADVLPGPGSSFPFNLIAGNDRVFFAADDGGGRALWASDGTTAGTERLHSAWPADTSQFPSFAEHAALGDAIFFTTFDGVWTSDGTVAGTVYVGPGGNELTVANGRLYYVHDDTLYESDGGPATPVPGTANGFPTGLSQGFGLLHLTLNGMFVRLEPSGTITVLSGNRPASSDPSHLTAVGDKVFFAASDPDHGEELWSSNGRSNNTVRIDLRPGPESSSAVPLIALGGALLFHAYDSDHGRELWRSDGTPAGTYLLRDIRPGPLGSGLTDPFLSGGTVYFRADDGARGQELWKTDGTAAGTVRVRDINLGFLNSAPTGFTAWNGYVYFSAEVFDEGRELWRTDGSEAGTLLVREINPDEGTASPGQLRPDGDRMFFTADDGQSGLELWLTDGTESGTQRIEDIAPGADSSLPSFMTTWNGALYFSAEGGPEGRELWRSDGTPGGTFLLHEIEPGTAEIDGLYAPLPIEDELLFVVGRAAPGCPPNCVYPDEDRELWKTDGTPSGTVLVRDIRPGPDDAAVAPEGELIELGGAVFFSANDGVTGLEPWTTDGTESGTLPLLDLAPGVIGSEPRSITLLPGGQRALMRVTDWVSGYELWETDGTAAGTTRIQDIAPGPAPSMRESPELTLAGNLVFFVADDGSTGRELWALPIETPGAVPDGGVIGDGPPLAVDRLGNGDVQLSWSSAACGPEAEDYAVYEGTLGDFTSHGPVVCGTGGNTDHQLQPPAGDAYYLVVPLSATLEGSYGKDSGGAERPAPTSACRPQVIYESCP